MMQETYCHNSDRLDSSAPLGRDSVPLVYINRRGVSSSTTTAGARTGSGEPTAERVDRLRDAAYRIRRHALDMGEVQGQGYIGQALGVADVLAVLFGDTLTFRPDDPGWDGRDRFLLLLQSRGVLVLSIRRNCASLPSAPGTA